MNTEKVPVIEVAYNYRTEYEESGTYMIGRRIFEMSQKDYEAAKKIQTSQDLCAYMNEEFVNFNFGKFTDLFYERFLRCRNFDSENIDIMLVNEECCGVLFDLDVRFKSVYDSDKNEFAFSIFLIDRDKYESMKDSYDAELLSLKRYIKYA